MPEGVAYSKAFSLPQSPIGDSPLVRGGHKKNFFDTLHNPGNRGYAAFVMLYLQVICN